MIILFFFNDTATTEIYTLSLHDALPILCASPARSYPLQLSISMANAITHRKSPSRQGREGLFLCVIRSEEHTSELQSRLHLVCRLLLEKKNTHANTEHARS